MATIVNTPGQTTDSPNNTVGVVLAVILVLAVIFFLIFYGIPALRSNNSGTTPNSNLDVRVNVPGSTNSGSTNGTGGGTTQNPGSGTQTQ